MSPEQRKQIAYDLALEYVKQHQILIGTESNIPQMVERFGEICEKFSDEISKSQKLQKLF